MGRGHTARRTVVEGAARQVDNVLRRITTPSVKVCAACGARLTRSVEHFGRRWDDTRANWRWDATCLRCTPEGTSQRARQRPRRSDAVMQKFQPATGPFDAIVAAMERRHGPIRGWSRALHAECTARLHATVGLEVFTPDPRCVTLDPSSPFYVPPSDAPAAR